MPAPEGRHPRNCLIYDQSQSLGLGRRTSRCARDGDGVGSSRRTACGRRRSRAAPTAAGRHEDETRNHHADQQDSEQLLPARAEARSEQRHSTDREQQGVEESC